MILLKTLRGRLMVGRQVLVLKIGVRVPASEQARRFAQHSPGKNPARATKNKNK